MNIADEAKRIAEKYRKYGVTERDVLQCIQSGRKAGFDDRTALAGVRLALAEAFGGREYFSLADVAGVLGMTVAEVNSTIEERKADILQCGELVSFDPVVFQMLAGGNDQ